VAGWWSPRHARVASDAVFLHAARWPFLVQQHCGVGSCTAVALSVWWCLPLRSFSAAVFTSVVFDTCMRAWSYGFALSFLSSLSVELWPSWCPNPTGQCVQLCGNPCWGPNPTGWVCFSFLLFSYQWSLEIIVLYFFCSINETRTVLCGSLKK
jgi:hypothetical protein